MRFVRIMPGETATDRTLQYSVTTCVQHGIYDYPVGPGIQFDIKTWDKCPKEAKTKDQKDRMCSQKRTIRRQTNEDGCLTWFGFLSHKYYHKEVLQEKLADVTFVGMHPLNSKEYEVSEDYKAFKNQYNKPFSYYMNPWDEKWTFGWDRPDMPQGYAEEIEELKETAPASKLFIADFKYETMGFRYEIDKFMNLIVKKAVLLKVYPMVLKYNSIILGRNGTEPLRDGIYLMKVGLQKDYLDPAAKGRKVYDVNAPSWDPMGNPIGEEEGRASMPVLVDADEEEFTCRDEPEKGETSKLKEGCKQYISIQKKLVRVMSGVIVTPIEMTVEDLRLMRIRNQFFIQLQTIDENILRLATLLDASIDDLENLADIEKKYEEAFRNLDDLKALDIEEEELQALIDNFDSETESAAARDRLMAKMDELQLSRKDMSQQLFASLGYPVPENGVIDVESDEFKRRSEEIKKKISELNFYRSKGFLERDRYARGAQLAYRNNKRQIINQILNNYGSRAESLINKPTSDWLEYIAEVNSDERTEEQVQNYVEALEADPLQKYFYLSSGSEEDPSGALNVLLYHRWQNAKSMAANDNLNPDQVNLLRAADFTEISLKPSFNLDILLNDGLEEHESGLPSRTFVGPLTFVLNTNGSALRPTDSMGETHCSNAPCSENDSVNFTAILDNHEAELRQGIVKQPEPHPGAPSSVEKLPEYKDWSPTVFGLKFDEKTQDYFMVDDPIYMDADSLNKKNEDNAYYGSLKKYANKTFDSDPESGRTGLIDDKRKLDEQYPRDMTRKANLTSYLLTLGLKHYSIYDEPKSRLKQEINSTCLDRAVGEKAIEQCFEDYPRTDLSVSEDELMSLLNERKGPLPEFKQTLKVFGIEADMTAHHDEAIERYWPTYINNKGEEESSWLDKKSSTHRPFIGEKKQISRKDLRRLIRWGFYKREKDLSDKDRQNIAKETKMYPEDGEIRPIDKDEAQLFTHRMCFALAQSFFSKEYFEKEAPKRWLVPNTYDHKENYDHQIVNQLELKCHAFADAFFRGAKIDGIDMTKYRFPPVVFEQKARVFKTSGKYVYRGGKSLNINIQASFSVDNSNSFSAARQVSWNPLGVVKEMFSTIVGGLGFSASHSSTTSHAIRESNGSGVSSGTFLVGQEATFVVELSEYERCTVARLNAKMLELFIKEQKNHWLKDGFDPETDINTNGFMICEGRVIEDNLPVNERFYYFTQHFTEGDMLDTAALHNHPWLLQMRGERDFQAFTAGIGHRRVKYIEDGVIKAFWNKITSDAEAMNWIGDPNTNVVPSMQLLDQDTEVRWPLESLGETYFNTLPTFPGLYTFPTHGIEPDWPYRRNNPSEALSD